MNLEDVSQLQKQSLQMQTQDLLAMLMERFGNRIALATSFGAEDQVLTDMLCRLSKGARIFTLDTGRVPAETLDTLRLTQQKYDITIEALVPDEREVAQMASAHGEDLFLKSVELRRLCCQVRKVRPLRRRLATLDAWITGLRREQSPTREAIDRVAWDEANGLIKVSPLADWHTRRVWDYIRAHNVPYNPLHDRGYPSIGCAPCTRAIQPGEDIRAGRWWWEKPEHKECGLHVVDGRLKRKGT